MFHVMTVFSNRKKTKPTDFEKWLSTNGYFYMKTKDNRPCFKSKLTCKLNKKFREEMRLSNSHKSKIFSFKFKG